MKRLLAIFAILLTGGFLQAEPNDERYRPFRSVADVTETPFYNVDHSPVGSYSTFVYGMEASGGVQVMPGRRHGVGELLPHDGLIIAVKRGNEIRVMPFAQQPGGFRSGVSLVTAVEARHTLSACTDHWQVPLGVKWTHYCPSWRLPDPKLLGSGQAMPLCCLPATWITFELNNTDGHEELQLLFSLKQRGAVAGTWGNLIGYTLDQHTAIAVDRSTAEAISAEQALGEFGVEGATSGLLLRARPGQVTAVTLVVAHYTDAIIPGPGGVPNQFTYTGYYRDLAHVLEAADPVNGRALPAAIRACDELDRRLAAAPINDARKFLSAHALHSYRFNTMLLSDAHHSGETWSVVEGEYGYINTFDLTVDQVFLELALHPWTVRNELELFASHYHYNDELSYPNESGRHSGGIGFTHDMGKIDSNGGFAKDGVQAYGYLMTQEELQNWILCAALYWHATGDRNWLFDQSDVLKKCLESMQLRDELIPQNRNGVTKLISNLGKKSGEITTYDFMDASLKQPNQSLYISVKSFACYLAMEAMFREMGQAALSADSKAAARKTASSIVSHFDDKARAFPAVFDGASQSKIIPAIEGLIYPYMLGMKAELSDGGPYGDLINRLRKHMETVLVPGVCIDPKTGGWRLSSTSASTWQSKVYLNQFVTEEVLGLRDDRTGGKVDQVHVGYEVLGAPANGWSDQIRDGVGTAFGGRHYPRGVTSALWWLNRKQ